MEKLCINKTNIANVNTWRHWPSVCVHLVGTTPVTANSRHKYTPCAADETTIYVVSGYYCKCRKNKSLYSVRNEKSTVLRDQPVDGHWKSLKTRVTTSHTSESSFTSRMVFLIDRFYTFSRSFFRRSFETIFRERQKLLICFENSNIPP